MAKFLIVEALLNCYNSHVMCKKYLKTAAPVVNHYRQTAPTQRLVVR